MDRNTFNSTIELFRERRPFRPFTVVMVDGNRVKVDRAAALAVGDGIAFFIATGNVPVIFDSGEVSELIGDSSGRGKGKKGRGK